MLRPTRAQVLLMALLVLPGCRRESRPSPRLPVAVSPREGVVGTGERKAFSARRLSLPDPGLVWSVKDPGLGLILGQGLFLAGDQAGTTDILATDLRSGQKGSATVTVVSQVSPGPRTAEVLNPGTGRVEATGALRLGRIDHGACLMADGRVLVVGGSEVPGGPALEAAETWDPASGQWRTLLAWTLPRRRPALFPLGDGRVLVAGGVTFGTPDLVECLDPDEERFQPLVSCSAAVGSCQWARLSNGQLLLLGESGIALVDPRTLAFRNLPLPGIPGIGGAHLLSLPDGNLLITGGDDRTEVRRFRVDTLTLESLGSLAGARWLHQAVLLPGERILVAGGVWNGEGHPEWVLLPGQTPGEPVPSLSQELPQGPSLTLPDGRILVVGAGRGDHGQGEVTALIPHTGTVRPLLSLHQGRLGHSLTLLRDGRVLVAGGYEQPGQATRRRRPGARS